MVEETKPLRSNIMFILLNIIFFSVMLFFVMRVGTGDTGLEQVYAKKIALLIDTAKPETKIILNITELIDAEEKNKYKTEINIENNIVNVKVVNGKGYSYKYFSDNNVFRTINRDKKKLILEIK